MTFFLRMSSGWDFASEEMPGLPEELPEELPSPKGGRMADAAPLLALKTLDAASGADLGPLSLCVCFTLWKLRLTALIIAIG